jgi:protein TonB
MMESTSHRTRAFPAGVATSTMLHVLVAAYLLLWITRTPPVVEQPVDLSKAIPIMMMDRRPPPPKPEPPKPKPKELPETIETTAVQQAVETPAEKVEPPKEPIVPQAAEPPPAGATYDQMVRGVIEHEKRYPREAQMSGDQGVAVVTFVINRYGTILTFTLDKRTGSSSLDAEIKRLMRRVHFPALQDGEYPGKERISFTIPVGWHLEG